MVRQQQTWSFSRLWKLQAFNGDGYYKDRSRGGCLTMRLVLGVTAEEFGGDIYYEETTRGTRLEEAMTHARRNWWGLQRRRIL